MKVKALKPFTLRDSTTGELTSVACGQVIDSADGAQLITDGLAEAYTLVTPTGTKSITENGTDIDVAQYAKANVNVPSVQPTGTVNIPENNATVDVSEYASANVAIPNVTLTMNGNYIQNVETEEYYNGWWASYISLEGEPCPVKQALTYPVTKGSTITPPWINDIEDDPTSTWVSGWGMYDEYSTKMGYHLLGWATTQDATTPNVTFPLKVEADTTIYAVWGATT